jgi:DNA polymerase II small subunit
MGNNERSGVAEIMLSELSSKGIRLTMEAEELVKSNQSDELLRKIISLEKNLVSKDDLEPLIQKKVEVRRPSGFSPIAKEHESTLKINHKYDVTGKSRTKGGVENFVGNFRNRYERLSRMLRRVGSGGNVDLGEISRHVNEKARIIVLISNIRQTKKGNLLFEVEDLTGTFKVVVSNSKFNEKMVEKGRCVLKDDVVAFTGKILEPYMIAEDVEWPDLPVVREKRKAEVDLASVYLSDLHFGSRYFLDRYLNSFVDWLHGKGEAKQLAGKVKYLHIAGDVVDGIGIYPNQEKELLVKDIYEQYRMLDDFIESLPDYIDVIIGPGNHDAVRRGDPQPAIGEDLIKSNVKLVGSPSNFEVEGVRHLMYHGNSIDSMISNIPGMTYMHPEKVMAEYLKRRHLSPIYGGNLIIPENVDYMVIDDPPDMFHCGHVHKNGYMQYRGTLIINSGTFQDRTDFQVKQGHVPTPALVPVYELKYGRLHMLDFKS